MIKRMKTEKRKPNTASTGSSETKVGHYPGPQAEDPGPAARPAAAGCLSVGELLQIGPKRRFVSARCAPSQQTAAASLFMMGRWGGPGSRGAV